MFLGICIRGVRNLLVLGRVWLRQGWIGSMFLVVYVRRFLIYGHFHSLSDHWAVVLELKKGFS